ncbi:hypothetical protein B0H11DRAFT_2200687 [Mycena galericulata]|nr:hypothetical protein B0H11DRAFT_2200687 [Mycena galericulata]
MTRTLGLRARLYFRTPAAAAHGTLEANSRRQGACGFGFGLKGSCAAARTWVGSHTVARGEGCQREAGKKRWTYTPARDIRKKHHGDWHANIPRRHRVDLPTWFRSRNAVRVSAKSAPNPVLNWVRGESEGKYDGVSMAVTEAEHANGTREVCMQRTYAGSRWNMYGACQGAGCLLLRAEIDVGCYWACYGEFGALISWESEMDTKDISPDIITGQTRDSESTRARRTPGLGIRRALASSESTGVWGAAPTSCGPAKGRDAVGPVFRSVIEPISGKRESTSSDYLFEHLIPCIKDLALSYTKLNITKKVLFNAVSIGTLRRHGGGAAVILVYPPQRFGNTLLHATGEPRIANGMNSRQRCSNLHTRLPVPVMGSTRRCGHGNSIDKLTYAARPSAHSQGARAPAPDLRSAAHVASDPKSHHHDARMARQSPTTRMYPSWHGCGTAGHSLPVGVAGLRNAVVTTRTARTP